MAYTLVFKRYAPFNSFGGGFHGDTRKTPECFGSARVWGFVFFNLEKGVISSWAMSSPTHHTFIPSISKTSKPNIDCAMRSKTSSYIAFTAHTEGSNPLTPGAPDIDTFIDIRFDGVTIEGCLRGDDFPSAEVFLLSGFCEDIEKKPNLMETIFPNALPKCKSHQLLCDYRTPHGKLLGPGTRLFGNHSGQFLDAFNKKITV